MAPPKPGTLKPGDICPCGCGGRMQYVDGVLTAVTIDVVGRGGHRTRVEGVTPTTAAGPTPLADRILRTARES